MSEWKEVKPWEAMKAYMEDTHDVAFINKLNELVFIDQYWFSALIETYKIKEKRDMFEFQCVGKWNIDYKNEPVFIGSMDEYKLFDATMKAKGITVWRIFDTVEKCIEAIKETRDARK